MLVFIILAKQAEMELFGNLQAMKCSNNIALYLQISLIISDILFVIDKTCTIKRFYICWGEGN